MLMQHEVSLTEEVSACFLDPLKIKKASEEPLMSCVSGPTCKHIYENRLYILQLQREESRGAGVVALFLLNAWKLRTKKCFFCVCVCK